QPSKAQIEEGVRQAERIVDQERRAGIARELCGEHNEEGRRRLEGLSQEQLAKLAESPKDFTRLQGEALEAEVRRAQKEVMLDKLGGTPELRRGLEALDHATLSRVQELVGDAGHLTPAELESRIAQARKQTAIEQLGAVSEVMKQRLGALDQRVL